MADFDSVRQTIDASIKQNGTGAITGPVLNGVLNEMVDAADEQVSQLGQEVVKKIVTYWEALINILDYTDIVSGKYIRPNDGEAANNGTFSASDFFSVESDNVYVFSGFGRLYGAWYDANKTYISGIQYDGTLPAGSTYTSPSNAKYLRVSSDTSFISGASVYKIGTNLNPDINIVPSQIEGIDGYDNSIIVPDMSNVIFPGKLQGNQSGKYIHPTDGSERNLATYTASDYIPIEGSKVTIKGLKGIYGAWYNENKVYISGIQWDSLSIVDYTTNVPSGAKYLRISGETTLWPQSILIIDDGAYLADYIKISPSSVEGLIRYNTIVVNPNGGGDFTTISAAFASITDAAYNNRYIVKFVGDGNEYNTLLDAPYTSGQKGLTIPRFTKLYGVGGPGKCILVRRLSTADPIDSVLNLMQTSELEGFTVIGVNTRYAVHDDFSNADDINLDYDRKVKNCVFRAGNTYYHRVYGAGVRSGCRWTFENCIFESLDGATNGSFSCHNNVSFSEPALIKFVNCRFKANHDGYKAVSFGSLNTNANGIVNVVEFYGCYMPTLRLYEESESTYGSGILFQVSGFANNLKTGDANITISNTDGVDYSDRIDLI